MTQPPPPYPPPNQPPTAPPPIAPPPIPPPPYGFPLPRRSRGRVVALVVAAVAAVLVLATAILVPVVLSRSGDDEGSGSSGADQGPTVDTSNLDAVEEYDGLDPTHVPEGQDVDYPQSPPVGGNHWPVWIECGAYDEPLPEEYAVHDLEHGSVWLTYRPDDVDDAGVASLAEQLPANGLLSPYPDQAAPVVITVWGRQLALTGPDDPRIALFIGKYGAGTTAPEPYASCHGGRDPSELVGSGGGPVA